MIYASMITCFFHIKSWIWITSVGTLRAPFCGTGPNLVMFYPSNLVFIELKITPNTFPFDFLLLKNTIIWFYCKMIRQSIFRIQKKSQQKPISLQVSCITVKSSHTRTDLLNQTMASEKWISYWFCLLLMATEYIKWS